MQRREFMTLLGGAVTSWRSLRTRSSVNNALECLSLELARRPVILLVHQLARIGYIEGSNVTYEIRGADGDINRLPQLARELTAGCDRRHSDCDDGSRGPNRAWAEQ